MNAEEKKKIVKSEKNIKKMQKKNCRTFAEFKQKKSLTEGVTDRLKKIVTR